MPEGLSNFAPRAWHWSAERDRRWLLASWVGLAALVGLALAFATDAGIGYDDEAQRVYGELVLAWFLSGFTDTSAMEYRDLYLYSGLFDVVAQSIAPHSPIGVFETRQLMTALIAILGVVAVWLMAARVGGRRAGFFAGLVLALTPAWVGHGLFNTKDIPFAVGAAFAGVASLRIAAGPAPVRIRDAALAGLAAGLALAGRPGGVFVLGYPCLAAALRIGLWLWRKHRAGEPLPFVRALVNLGVVGVLVVLIAWPVMVSAWPWAQLDPLHRPFEAMAVARNFPPRGTMLWNGMIVESHALPRSYLPRWFNVTLPEIYLLALVTGLVLLVQLTRRRGFRLERVITVGLLLTFVVLPFGAILITRPTLYDAHRHVLFLLPPLAALAGSAIAEIVTGEWLPRLARGACAAVFVGLAVLVAIDTVQLHPYEYSYFNRWSGGIRKQYKRYETDYWGTSFKEGLRWVFDKHPGLPDRRLRVAGCDRSAETRLRYYMNEWPGAREKIRIVGNYQKADVFLGIRRYDCHKVPGKVLHVVRRQGAPLLYIRRTEH